MPQNKHSPYKVWSAAQLTVIQYPSLYHVVLQEGKRMPLGSFWECSIVVSLSASVVVGWAYKYHIAREGKDESIHVCVCVVGMNCDLTKSLVLMTDTHTTRETA